MARGAVLAILILSCGSALPACDAVRYHDQIASAMFTPQKGDRARLEVRDRVPILHLYGTPQEMGRQYGELMRPALEALSEYAKCTLLNGQRDQFLDYGRQHEQFLPEGIRQQLQAMAEAGGIGYDELVALNVIPQFQCSALAVWGPATLDGHMILGRNGDFSSVGLDDCANLLVVYHPNVGRPVALVTFLGMAGGFTGMNDRGVAFGNMLVHNAPCRREDVLPLQLALRVAAEDSGSAREMVDCLTDMKHLIPNNVIVVDSREAFVAELGCDSACIRHGSDGVLAACNQFLEHPDRLDAGHSFRYDVLVGEAGRHRGAMTAETMKSALFAARTWWINYRATIFEPQEMRMHVSINRNDASAGPYVLLDVLRLLAE